MKFVQNTPTISQRTFQSLAAKMTLLVGLFCAPSAFAADANPPERMAYQGYMTDSNGTVLGQNAPANYDAIFRIWSLKEGGTNDDLLWSEQQTVTFDKGYFSVLLGEGSNVGSEPRGTLASVFQGSNASDRYIDITVLGLPGGNLTLVPRIKYLASPYSYLASHSRSSDRILGTNLDTNQAIDLIKTSGENVGVGLADGVNPDAQLDVNGSTKLRSTLSVGEQSIFTGGAAIGKNSAPTATLDVEGDIKVSGAFSLANNLTITGGNINVTPPFTADNVTAYPLIATYPGSPSYKLNLEMRPERWAIGSTGSSQIMYLNNGGHYSFWIWPNGKVGVGGDLEVRGNTTAKAINASSLTTTGNINNQPNGVIYSRGIYSSEALGSENIRPYTWGSYVKMLGTKALTVSTGSDWYNGRTFELEPDGDGIKIHVLNSYWGRGTYVWRHAFYSGGSAWGFNSDARLKKDIRDAEPMMKRLMQVPVRRFRWKDTPNDERQHLGVVAQEVESLFPEVVQPGSTEATIPFAPGEKDMKLKAVTYSTFGLLAVKGLQELKAEKDDEIQQLKEAVAERDARIAELDARLAELDAGQSKILELEERLNALAGSLSR